MNRTLLVIILIAVALRLAFSLGFTRGVLGILPEEEITDGYDRIAESLYQGDGYREFPDQPPTLLRPPGYPVFLVGLFHLFGIRYLAVQIVQALLGGLGCWILYRFGRWILSERLGLAAAALYAVYPNSILYASRLYAENLYYPLFLGFAYFLCRASIEGSRARGLAAGFLWGLGILTRGTLLALPLALPAGIALSRRHRSPVSRWIRWSLPALLGAALLVVPWTIRNHNLTGRTVLVSSWAWAPFYHGIQSSKGMLRWKDLRQIDLEAYWERDRIVVERLYGGDRTKAYASAEEFVRHEEVARALVLEELARDPLGAVGRTLVGIVFTWFQTLGPRMRILSLVVHLPLMILFVAGIRRMARGDPEAFARAWPALGLILFVNLFQAAVYPHVRYMSPAIALSFLFSGLPLADAIASRRRP